MDAQTDPANSFSLSIASRFKLDNDTAIDNEKAIVESVRASVSSVHVDTCQWSHARCEVIAMLA